MKIFARIQIYEFFFCLIFIIVNKNIFIKNHKGIQTNEKFSFRKHVAIRNQKFI